MQCSCVYVGDTGEGYDFSRSKIVTAKKDHKCCECRQPIATGSKYEYVFGVWYGDPDTHKTCLDCLSVRNIFFCDGWWYEQLWDQLKEHIDGAKGDISESCISALTPLAREKVCALIESVWCELEIFYGK